MTIINNRLPFKITKINLFGSTQPPSISTILTPACGKYLFLHKHPTYAGVRTTLMPTKGFHLNNRMGI